MIEEMVMRERRRWLRCHRRMFGMWSGARSQKGLFSSAGTVTLSTWREKTYLKNDFLDEKCHLSKKAVCDCSPL